MTASFSERSSSSKSRFVLVVAGFYSAISPWLLMSFTKDVIGKQMSMTVAAYYTMLSGLLSLMTVIVVHMFMTRHQSVISPVNKPPLQMKAIYFSQLIGIIFFLAWVAFSSVYNLMNREDMMAYGLSVFLSTALISAAVFLKDEI